MGVAMKKVFKDCGLLMSLMAGRGGALKWTGAVLRDPFGSCIFERESCYVAHVFIFSVFLS